MESAQIAIQTIRYPVVDTSEIIEIKDDIVEKTCPTVVNNNKIYVAVGTKLKESQPTLQWAIENSGGRHLHVHQPPEKIPFSNLFFVAGIINTHQVVAHHKAEKQHMLKLLKKYNQICEKSGVCAEVQYIEMESIEKGIVEFICKHNVRNLVMGAAADRQYSRKMVDLRSKKAIYVCMQATASCQIQFICKGNIIFTRPGRLDGLGVSRSSSSSLPDTTSNSELNSSLSRSVSERQNTILQVNSSTRDCRKVNSDFRRTGITTSLRDFNVNLTPTSRFSSGSATDFWNGISQRTHSSSSRLSTCSSEVIDDSALYAYAINEVDSEFGAFKERVQNRPPSSVIQEKGMNDELYDQLVEAMAEAENSKREAFEESIRRRKAEKDAIEAKIRARESENFYEEEYRRRREIEEMLEKNKEEHENICKKLNEAAEELRITLDEKSFLKSQIADFDHKVRELEHKLFSSIELLQNYKKERDKLQIEYDDALRVVEELKKKQANEASSSSVYQLYTEFDFSEVKDATQNFDPFFKIGESGYGTTFRGFIRHTEVAIKMFYSHNPQVPSVFQHEVNILSKMRHPNLVTLIGACPDDRIIIYEYLSGCSLEDRLECKNNTPPLSWKNRIRIAAELCSVLLFLHSCGIVHGNLKPTNILLDTNFVTKLSDFRTFSSNNMSLYMDPEFLSTKELTSESDTYSFGVILLRLLTGKPALGLLNEVQLALNNENLKNVLDSTAGDWPFVQAQQLAVLAMNCCDVVRKIRPDLATEVWRVLEPMCVSCGPSSFRLGSEGQCQVPNYFVCPIFQEIMQDPVVSADGFTYEAEAIKGWLDSGHNTSPMTNLKLANSTLVPNHALRSAIQEWLQQS
ncbi:U-box domain-containing protein 33-like [Rutidosis leptorrhynchoides]|uniref:U-box domain-containing protein 33-like n=1 Tax=Rutidosis leptorrhynchoides TaxID=125765 RepID=UPI003A997BF4